MTHRCLAGLALWAVLSVPAMLFAGQKEKTFNVPSDVLFESAVKIAAEHYKLQYADSQRHSFAFRTGVSAASYGFNVTALVQTLGTNQSRLVMDIQNADSRQKFAWGGGGRVADDLFKRIDDDLRAWYPVKFEAVITKPQGSSGLFFEDDYIPG